MTGRDLQDLIPARDTDDGIVPAHDIDIVAAAQERRGQINAHIQEVLQLCNKLPYDLHRETIDRLTTISKGAKEAWLDDVNGLRSALGYARDIRVQLENVTDALNDLRRAARTADRDHELIAKLDEALYDAHIMEYELQLLAKIENANNGMTFQIATGILAALQAQPVGHYTAPHVADWLRYIADEVEQSQEQAS